MALRTALRLHTKYIVSVVRYARKKNNQLKSQCSVCLWLSVCITLLNLVWKKPGNLLKKETCQLQSHRSSICNCNCICVWYIRVWNICRRKKPVQNSYAGSEYACFGICKSKHTQREICGTYLTSSLEGSVIIQLKYVVIGYICQQSVVP